MWPYRLCVDSPADLSAAAGGIRRDGGLGESVPGFCRTHRPIRQDASVEVDLDVASLELPTDELLGKRILDVALDRPAQRTRAVRAILACLLDDPVDHLRLQFQTE